MAEQLDTSAQRPGIRPEAEQLQPPEAVMRTQEIYTVEGSDVIRAFKEAMEIGELDGIREAASEAIAFCEGLYYGPYGEDYDLSDRRVLVGLMDQFTDKERSMERPQSTNVFLAVREGLTYAVREAKRYSRNPENWKNARALKSISFWRNISRENTMRGMPPLTEERIRTLALQDVLREEDKVRKWAVHTNDFMALKEHANARVAVFDRAFQQRQQTCESDDDSAKLLSSGVSPDKGSWLALYQGSKESDERLSKWGDAVSKVQRAIIQIAEGQINLSGVPNSKDIYVNGFRTTGEFKAWLSVLLEHSKIDGQKRMDVVWMAWRMNLLTEEITRVGWKINDKGEYEFGVPPMCGSLAQKLIHPGKVQMKEYGWLGVDRQGRGLDPDSSNSFILRVPQRVPNKFPAISHSGHPLAIGRIIGRLSDTYYRNSKVKLRASDGEIYEYTLFDLWYTNGLSFADPTFPWAKTETVQSGDEPGELPSGSFGGWLLKRFRSHAAWNKYVTKILPQAAWTEELLTSSDMRTLEKLGLIKPGKLDWVSGNRRDGFEPKNWIAYSLAASIFASKYRSPGASESGGNRYTRGELGFHFAGNQNKITHTTDEGKVLSERATPDVLADAVRAGVISPDECAWIQAVIVDEVTIKQLLKLSRA